MRTALLLVPGGGAGLVALAVVRVADENVAAGIALSVCLPVFAVLTLWGGGLQLRVPAWFVPSWAREGVGRRRAAAARRR